MLFLQVTAADPFATTAIEESTGLTSTLLNEADRSHSSDLKINPLDIAGGPESINDAEVVSSSSNSPKTTRVANFASTVSSVSISSFIASSPSESANEAESAVDIMVSEEVSKTSTEVSHEPEMSEPKSPSDISLHQTVESVGKNILLYSDFSIHNQCIPTFAM